MHNTSGNPVCRQSRSLEDWTATISPPPVAFWYDQTEKRRLIEEQLRRQKPEQVVSCKFSTKFPLRQSVKHRSTPPFIRRKQLLLGLTWFPVKETQSRFKDSLSKHAKASFFLSYFTWKLAVPTKIAAKTEHFKSNHSKCNWIPLAFARRSRCW